MRSIQRLGTILSMLVCGAVLPAGCSQVLCDGTSFSKGGCDPADYQMTVEPSTQRTNLREAAPLTLKFKSLRRDNPNSFPLRNLPPVTLSQNDDPGSLVKASLKPALDNKASEIEILRNPEQLQLGQLTGELTLTDFPMPVRTDGRHRVFFRPKFGAGEELAATRNTNRGATVLGRTAVQIASPISTPGKLLVSELIDPLAGGRQDSWIDLYERKPNGHMDYSIDLTWQNTQTKLQESKDALFGLISGAVLIYDTDSAAGRKDLWLMPLQQMRSAKLSTYENQIPGDAVALATCGEELAFLLARSGDVRVFLAAPVTMNPIVRSIGGYSVTGLPVVAARGVLGTVPKRASSAFLAASVDASGQVILVQLGAPAMTGDAPPVKTSSVTSAALQAVGAISALALADLDNDGLQDLVMARKTDGSLVYFPQYPDGSFPEVFELGIGQPNTSSISIGDLSGDTLPDLALATTDKRAFVYFNQP